MRATGCIAALPRCEGLRAFPTAANFVLIRCEAQPAAEVFRRLVEQHGILVRNVSAGPGLEGCLRITAGTMEDVDAVLAGAHGDFQECTMSRVGEARRKTKETEVRVRLDLDGSGRAEVKTGIGFFDHMLEALARHALYDLDLSAAGDLHVDAHHTVEDVGIVLGQALAQALGERRGIRRYGDATVPLDDALARVVVDVSGRPYLAFHADPPTWQKLGDYDVALTPEFFRAFATHGGLTLHVDLLRGQNAHHVVEAVFKATARALGEATSIDPRVQGVPSTKGTLA